MSKYLLEVGVEELPYKFIPMAISQLKTGFETFLKNSNVELLLILSLALDLYFSFATTISTYF